MAPPISYEHQKWTRQASASPPRKKRRLQRGLRPGRDNDENLPIQEPALAYATPTSSPAKPTIDRPDSSIAALERRFGASPPAPAHPVFACGWQGCSAVLHNLATLQQHLTRRHCRKQDDHYICSWIDCVATGSRLVFETDSDWAAHIWHSHVAEIAWQYGDGPRAGFIDPEVWKEQTAIYPPLPIAVQARLRQHTRPGSASTMNESHEKSASDAPTCPKHDRKPAAASNEGELSNGVQEVSSPRPMVISLLSDEDFIEVVDGSD